MWNKLWGPKEHGRPNFHYMLHIVECIREFGPVHAFQTFATERLAGDMGSHTSNAVMPNVTLFRKFCHLQELVQVRVRVLSDR